MIFRAARRIGAGLKRFCTADSGVSAIEFGFVAPPFFLLLGVIMETGLMFFTEYAIQSGVQDAARLVRTGQAQMGTMTAAAFKTKICATAGILIDCSGKLTVYVRSDANFASLQANMPPLLNIGPTTGGGTISAPACFNPGQPSQPAAVAATYDWYFSMWGMRTFGNVAGGAARRLEGFAIFLNEPYPGTTPGVC
jgi:Flp pilus assembly protein TadG